MVREAAGPVTAIRVAVNDGGGVFAFGDTFDGVDEARQAAQAATGEFPGAQVDVQELVPHKGRLVWRSVDAPASRPGFFSRLFRS